jgi:hypothetical protein
MSRPRTVTLLELEAATAGTWLVATYLHASLLMFTGPFYGRRGRLVWRLSGWHRSFHGNVVDYYIGIDIYGPVVFLSVQNHSDDHQDDSDVRGKVGRRLRHEKLGELLTPTGKLSFDGVPNLVEVRATLSGIP